MRPRAQPGDTRRTTVLSVVGYRTVYELAEKEVGLSGKQVDDLIAIRRRLTREQAIELESDRRQLFLQVVQK